MRERVAVHPIVDEHGGRRIAIHLRADGCFSYVEEWRVCFGHIDEVTWSSEFDHSHSGVYDSPETALEEAERDVAWLRERLRQARNPEPTFPVADR